MERTAQTKMGMSIPIAIVAVIISIIAIVSAFVLHRLLVTAPAPIVAADGSG